jgi:hypothetical protein
MDKNYVREHKAEIVFIKQKISPQTIKYTSHKTKNNTHRFYNENNGNWWYFPIKEVFVKLNKE